MFLGLSKNVGNGFRIGVGTQLKSKKPSSKELNTKEFQEFMEKVENDLQEAIIIIVEANGYDFKEVLKGKSDFDEKMKDNQIYKQFEELTNEVSTEIEKVLYSGDNGVVAKRKITDSVFKIKTFINETYPNFQPKYKPKKKAGILKAIFWIFVIFMILSAIAGNDKKPTTDKTSTQQTIQKNNKD